MTVETIYATRLRVPGQRGAVRLREIPLKGMPIDYLVQQHHGWWMVTRLTDGETVYAGYGPVELVVSSSEAVDERTRERSSNDSHPRPPSEQCR